MEDVLKNSQHRESRHEQSGSIWTVNFTLLCLANFALFISMHIFTPTLPLYLFKIGGDQKHVGYVMAAFTVGAMTMRPITGWLVDNYGRKKIMILGIGLGLIVSLLYKFATHIPTMLVLRAFHGLTYGLFSTAIATMVADVLPINRLSEGMGYFGLTSSLSMAVSPIIGFWLIGKYGFPLLFLVVILLTLLAFIFSFTVRASTTPINAPIHNAKDIWAGMLEKTALPAAGVIFFIAIVYGSVFSYIALYATELGIANIGLFFTANAIAMLISRPLSGRWSDKGGINSVLFLGLLMMSIAMTGISLSHTIKGLILAGAGFGLGAGFCIPTLQGLSVRHAQAHKRGAATGTFLIALDLGIGLGTVICGYIAEATSYQTMYFTTLIPIILAWATYSIFKNFH